MTIAVSPQLRPATAVPSRPLVRIVIVGHVDHGKSTLIGRLLHETGSLPDGKLETLKAVSARRGMKFEWSFLLDALQTERDQGITIDTSQIHFRTVARDFVLIDAPGHAEFLRNMITGAAQADAALLIVDAGEGVRDQTRRHGYLLHLLGVRQVAVVINKMDRIGFDAERFRAIEAEITAHLNGLGLMPTAVIPISARHGDGVARRTDAIAWHEGPTVLAALDAFAPARRATDLPLRFPVQAIYKFDDRRIVAGRVESGSVAVGDEIVVMPGEKQARVRTIEAWPVPDAGEAPHAATAGQSIGITLDRELFVERGNVIALAATPPTAAKRLTARVFWLDARPLAVGGEIVARIGTAASRAVVRAIENALDPGLLASDGAEVIGTNHVGEIEIELAQALAADPHAADAAMGRLVLDFDGRIAGGGLVLEVSTVDSQPSWPGLTRPSIEVAKSVSRSGWTRGSSPRVTAESGERAAILAQQLAPLSAGERIARLRRELAGKIVFTTSFGLEDQAILHLIAEHGSDIEVVTLDTGRLFPETHALWADTERRYGIRIRALYPRHDDLEALVERHGINGFYESRAARVACCQVRKIEPLGRALAGAQGWIAGLRAEQSAHRRDMAVSAERGLIKLNPLFDWSRTQLEAFVAAHDVPVNTLHGKGFASIGCAPCTRPIAPGEPERAGRWWWEHDEKTECGLHR
jgi:sulfate adenylyltransferase large subunit/phosphoadenylyl-sulfate reductase (thioredoxin)